MNPLVTGMLGFGLLTGAAITSADAQGRAADFNWHGTVAAGQWVEVKGVNGHVRAEPTTGPEVEIVGTWRGRDEDDGVVVQAVRNEGGGVTVCALYRSVRGIRTPDCSPGAGWNGSNDGFRTSIDFVVKVPAGVHFLGATVNGDVTAMDMPADAIASTVNGRVRVSAAGVVEASTVNGNIDAEMGRADPDHDLSFNSVNGSVTIRLPADFRARVRLSSRGRVASDFPLESTGRQARHGPTTTRLEGEIGGGGEDLEVSTLNGSITLRRGGKGRADL